MITGLTNSEVLARREQGQGNDIKLSTSRTYRDIVRSNVFNPVNIVLYVIGFGMLLVGDTRSAVTTVGLVVFNAAVSLLSAQSALTTFFVFSGILLTVFAEPPGKW